MICKLSLTFITFFTVRLQLLRKIYTISRRGLRIGMIHAIAKIIPIINCNKLLLFCKIHQILVKSCERYIPGMTYDIFIGTKKQLTKNR